MTRALDAAIAKLSKLSAGEQDRIAQWLLDELRDEEDDLEFRASGGSSQDLIDSAKHGALRADILPMPIGRPEQA